MPAQVVVDLLDGDEVEPADDLRDQPVVVVEPVLDAEVGDVPGSEQQAAGALLRDRPTRLGVAVAPERPRLRGGGVGVVEPGLRETAACPSLRPRSCRPSCFGRILSACGYGSRRSSSPRCSSSSLSGLAAEPGRSCAARNRPTPEARGAVRCDDPAQQGRGRLDRRLEVRDNAVSRAVRLEAQRKRRSRLSSPGSTSTAAV